MSDSVKRKLTVTAQKELATFKNDKDEPTTIYEVKAVTEAGEAVSVKLRTFQSELPQGELIEYDVTPYDHPEHGRSYTIKIPGKGRASKKDIAELKTQLSDIAGRVSALEDAVAALKPKTEAEKARDEKFGADDDVPF
jgi:type II secretory pathway component PulF